jgi:ABC-type transport system involved in Fe-S cluster assembly fused permease/ATPase subunit
VCDPDVVIPVDGDQVRAGELAPEAITEDTVSQHLYTAGLPDPDLQAIERAARLAQAWAFIGALPQGLATRIGDDGVRLSGGRHLSTLRM